MASALQLGLELMTKGEKAANKTSFFGKKNPDWDTARVSYETAALKFKEAKAFDHQQEAHVKAANAYKEQDSIYLAAKQLEMAAQVSVANLNNPVEGARLYHQACDYFVAHGSPDRGAELLEKAAKALETVDVNQAAELYVEACTIFETEDRLRTGADTFARAVCFLLRVGKLPQAIDLSQRLCDLYVKIQNRHSFNKQALTTVILALVLGDPVEAGKRLQSLGGTFGFFESDEGFIANGMIEAFNNFDDDKLQELKRKQIIMFLDNEVARATQSLRVTGGGGGRPAGGYSQGASTSNLVDDDDEDDDGLC
ncbi:hypothetical protein HDV05_003370 [Chytridiales sp. JEL 0842]|nr:hypothetical protein HDV05_003370 [Chytridiales sp. JEL 0842]